MQLRLDLPLLCDEDELGLCCILIHSDSVTPLDKRNECPVPLDRKDL